MLRYDIQIANGTICFETWPYFFNGEEKETFNNLDEDLDPMGEWTGYSTVSNQAPNTGSITGALNVNTGQNDVVPAIFGDNETFGDDFSKWETGGGSNIPKTQDYFNPDGVRSVDIFDPQETEMNILPQETWDSAKAQLDKIISKVAPSAMAGTNVMGEGFVAKEKDLPQEFKDNPELVGALERSNAAEGNVLGARGSMNVLMDIIALKVPQAILQGIEKFVPSVSTGNWEGDVGRAKMRLILEDMAAGKQVQSSFKALWNRDVIKQFPGFNEHKLQTLTKKHGGDVQAAVDEFVATLDMSEAEVAEYQEAQASETRGDFATSGAFFNYVEDRGLTIEDIKKQGLTLGGKEVELEPMWASFGYPAIKDAEGKIHFIKGEKGYIDKPKHGQEFTFSSGARYYFNLATGGLESDKSALMDVKLDQTKQAASATLEGDGAYVDEVVAADTTAAPSAREGVNNSRGIYTASTSDEVTKAQMALNQATQGDITSDDYVSNLQAALDTVVTPPAGWLWTDYDPNFQKSLPQKTLVRTSFAGTQSLTTEQQQQLITYYENRDRAHAIIGTMIQERIGETGISPDVLARITSDEAIAKSLHALEESRFRNDQAYQSALLTGLYESDELHTDGPNIGQPIMKATLSREELDAKLTDMFGVSEAGKETLAMKEIKARMLGTFGDAETIDMQKFKAEMTGLFAGSPTLLREIQEASAIAAKTEIMKAAGELITYEYKTNVKGTRVMVETGERVDTLAKQIHELNEKIALAKLTGTYTDSQGRPIATLDARLREAEIEHAKLLSSMSQATQMGAQQGLVYTVDVDGNITLAKDEDGQPIKTLAQKQFESDKAIQEKQIDVSRDAITAQGQRQEVAGEQALGQIAATGAQTMAQLDKQLALDRERMGDEILMMAERIKAEAARQGIQLSHEEAMAKAEREYVPTEAQQAYLKQRQEAEVGERSAQAQQELMAKQEREYVPTSAQQEYATQQRLATMGTLSEQEQAQQMAKMQMEFVPTEEQQAYAIAREGTKSTQEQEVLMAKLAQEFVPTESQQAYQIALRNITVGDKTDQEYQSEVARLQREYVPTEQQRAYEDSLRALQVTQERALGMLPYEAGRVAAEQARMTSLAQTQRTLAAQEREALRLTADPTFVQQAQSQATAYTSSLNAAMSAASTGNFDDVATALGQALPPAPVGVMWNSSTATFMQRPGFEGREMDEQTRNWISSVTPAFKARDRASRAIEESVSLTTAARIQRQEREQADADFREHMLTGDIDSAEESIARQRIAETRQIENETRLQNLQMLFGLLSNPVQLAFAKKHGLLGQIEAVLGFAISNVPESATGPSIPNVNEWISMDSEQQQFAIAEFVERGGTPDAFMQLVGGTAPGQTQTLQYATL